MTILRVNIHNEDRTSVNQRRKKVAQNRKIVNADDRQKEIESYNQLSLLIATFSDPLGLLHLRRMSSRFERV